MLFYFHPGDLDISVLPALIVIFVVVIFVFIGLPFLVIYKILNKPKDEKK